MRNLLILLTPLLLASGGPLAAQHFSSVHYDSKDGLPSETVYDISQDAKGFIWFATENGLCRFDGKNFRTYTTHDGLPDNSILKVFGDKTGRVYINPFTHSIFYYSNDSFYRLPLPPQYKLDLAGVSQFAGQSKRLIIFGTQETYELAGNEIQSFHDKYGVVAKNVNVGRVFDSLVILALDDSIYYLRDNGSVQQKAFPLGRSTHKLFNDSGQVVDLGIRKSAVSTPGGYLAGSMKFLLLDSSVVHFFSTKTGRLLFRFAVEKFSNAFVDNEDNLWISTLGNGVYRIPSRSFRSIPFSDKPEIFSFLRIKEQVLAGSDFSKVFVINTKSTDASPKSMNFSSFLSRSKNPTAVATRRNRIMAMQEENGDLYLGTDAFVLKLPAGQPAVFRAIHPVKDIDVFQQQLLVCTGYNAYLLDAATMNITDTIIHQRTTCGLYWSGYYYFGTIGGLVRIKKGSHTIERLFERYQSFQNRIVALRRGGSGELWVATSGAGLVRIAPDNSYSIISEKQGLTSDICTSLFVGGTEIWLGTNKGLNRIELLAESPRITHFSLANGLAADYISSILVTDSQVFAGSPAGITVFPKNQSREKSICELQWLGITENGRRLPVDSTYSFPNSALNIQINFTAISFKSAGEINYQYRMEGLSNEWTNTASNYVNFATLHPGTYHFLLKATNRFGVQSVTKHLTIEIRPSWWQTWWFQALSVLMTAMLIFFVYRHNIRNIRKKEKIRREFESRFAALEQRALQAQMNPHFIFNALNSIQNFILNLDAEGANRYLSSFASLIRQTLENSLQPLISLSSEIQYLETYLQLEKLRFGDQLNYKFEIDELVEPSQVFLPPMLLQPYVENAIRHGIQHRNDSKGMIAIRISRQDDQVIEYQVIDNGVGREKSAELKSLRHIEYHSRGIAINEKRIAAINAQYNARISVDIRDRTDATGKPEGTVVIVTIPKLGK